MSLTELQEFGLTEMDDGEIDDFLSNQRTGVLGLTAQSGPYLLPLSFGFDDDSTLYFTYLVSPESRKVTLSESVETAPFLVYDIQSSFTWQSVLLEGELSRVPEEEWGDIEDVLDDAWRPEVLETARENLDVAVYAFDVTDRSGVKHAGLPPAMQ